jgi:hypothetical protein
MVLQETVMVLHVTVIILQVTLKCSGGRAVLRRGANTCPTVVLEWC